MPSGDNSAPQTSRAAIRRYRAFVISEDGRSEAHCLRGPSSAATAFLQQFSEWRDGASREVPRRTAGEAARSTLLFRGAAHGHHATRGRRGLRERLHDGRRFRGFSRSTRARSVGSSRSSARCQVVRNVWIQDLTPPHPIDGGRTAASTESPDRPARRGGDMAALSQLAERRVGDVTIIALSGRCDEGDVTVREWIDSLVAMAA